MINKIFNRCQVKTRRTVYVYDHNIVTYIHSMSMSDVVVLGMFRGEYTQITISAHSAVWVFLLAGLHRSSGPTCVCE